MVSNSAMARSDRTSSPKKKTLAIGQKYTEVDRSDSVVWRRILGDSVDSERADEDVPSLQRRGPQLFMVGLIALVGTVALTNVVVYNAMSSIARWDSPLFSSIARWDSPLFASKSPSIPVEDDDGTPCVKLPTLSRNHKVKDEERFLQVKSVSNTSLNVNIRSARNGEEAQASDFTNHRILVTGGAGFIGMHTVIKLASMGNEVVAYDNLNSYYSPELKMERVEHILLYGEGILGARIENKYDKRNERNPIQFVKGDVCNRTLVLDTLRSNRIDRIIHLAAQAGVRYSLKNPLDYTHNNVDCFIEIMEAVVEHSKNFTMKSLVNPTGVGDSDKITLPLIYASSSSVYGSRSATESFKETDSIMHPESVYGATKAANEILAGVYHRLHGMPSVGLRFFTVYGPWGRPDMAIYKFTDRVSRGLPIDIYNNGEMWRDFTYVEDIVDGIVGCLPLVDTLSETASTSMPKVLNLGRGHPQVLRTVVEVIEQSLNTTAVKNNKGMQPGDVPATYADISRARCLVGYNPTTPIEVGIPKFVQWFKQHNGTRFYSPWAR